MKAMKINCLIAAVGAAMELLALALALLGNCWWAAAAAGLLGLFVCLIFIGEIWKSYLETSRFLRFSLQNSGPAIPERCAFSEEINALLKNYRESVSTVNLKTAFRNTQLQVLMEQINPHFLYNTLESIRGQALCSGSEIVADMAETLSLFFRYCISRKGAIVRLKDEIQNVKIYLKIMEFRFPDKFTFDIIGADPAVTDYEIPKLTLQPIVENAILHGIMDYISGGKITLRILDAGDSLKIYVRDNGLGIADEQVKTINERLLADKDLPAAPEAARGGIALYNINRRIKLTYGADFGLRVFSTEKAGTNVMILLPKVPLEEEG